MFQFHAQLKRFNVSGPRAVKEVFHYLQTPERKPLQSIGCREEEQEEGEESECRRGQTNQGLLKL